MLIAISLLKIERRLKGGIGEGAAPSANCLLSNHQILASSAVAAYAARIWDSDWSKRRIFSRAAGECQYLRAKEAVT